MRMDTYNPDLVSDEPYYDMPDVDEDAYQYDMDGNVIGIEHPDGSITISLDGKPLVDDSPQDNDKWFANIADKMDEYTLSSICEGLLTRIEEDIEARQQKIGVETKDIMNLLGFTRKAGTTQGLQGSLNGISNFDIRHPLLLQAAVSFQANMHAELLPTDGPLKIHDYSVGRMGQYVDQTGQSDAIDELADDFETLMNFYLMKGAPEYYPELDRLLFMGGLSGDAFQKVFNCPIRNRPVIETVDYDNLIVNVDATDLSNADRITQIVRVSSNNVLRMQILGVYRDISLSRPTTTDMRTPYDMAKNIFQGLSSASYAPDDEDVHREIYECRCKLDLPGYSHKIRGKETGLKVPYVVVIDKESREILSIIRNYKEDDIKQDPIDCFVRFPFIPADYGFYSIGLAKLLQNPTIALTRAWQICLDSGYMSTYPGGLIDQNALKGDSSLLSVPPGGWTPVNVGVGKTIADVVHPMPYKPIDGQFISFQQQISDSFQAIANSTEKMVAEGRADAPVGTTVALLEEAQKVMSAVHKRYLAAQGKTFEILIECFQRDPGAFLRFDKGATRNWDVQLFLQALERFTLIPKADPNTASHIQRMAKVEFMVSMAKDFPDIVDRRAVIEEAFRAAKVPSPERFIVPPQPQGPTPQDQAAQVMAQAKTTEANAKMMMAQSKDHENQVKLADSKADAVNRAAETESRERIARLNLFKETIMHPGPDTNSIRNEAEPVLNAPITNPMNQGV